MPSRVEIEALNRRIAQTVAEAHRNLEPAKAGSGASEISAGATINRNRWDDADRRGP